VSANAPRAYTLETVLSPRAQESLRHLELFARRTVEGLLHGIHRSRRKGVSTDFDHHKLYQPGDPLKHVDWKVSARHDRYFVKRYLEDTALAVRLVVDGSASMRRTTEGESKYLQAARLAACLAYLVLKERDGVGLVWTSEGRTEWLPVQSTNTHLVRILQVLAAEEAAGEDHLERSLRTLLDRAERRGLVVAISDLMFDPEPVRKQLARLAAQGQEVLLCQLRDPAEEDFPFNRWVQFRDLENPALRHRLDAVPLKKIYREEYQALLASWRAFAKKHDIHFISARTDEPVETLLSAYLVARSGGTGA
jgi:uncharacterized protein (DUF58 family)